jgi:ectoine hydroxylase-related dioxygenase (phytanoyl-CoA dioxygenase family)
MASRSISEDQVEQFHDRGYLLLPEYFDDDRVEEMRAEVNRILELRINSTVANDRQGALGLVRDADGNVSLRSMMVIFQSRLFHRLATTEVADLLRPLMDDDPVCLDTTSKLNPKQPLPNLSPDTEELDIEQRRTDYPVHTDWVYYRRSGYPEGIITSAVLLDDVEADSGPIQVWPGTHTRALDHVDSDIGGWEVDRDQIDYDAGQPVLGPAGSVLLFHSKLVHSSEPNTSGRPRRLMIYGHAPRSNVDADIEDGAASPELQEGYPSPVVDARYHNEYRRTKQRGEFTDVFSAPDPDDYPV